MATTPGDTPQQAEEVWFMAAGSTQACRTRSWWGWGFDDEALEDEACVELGRSVHVLLGGEPPELRAPASLDQVAAAAKPPRIDVPAVLHRVITTNSAARVRHAAGRSFVDIVRAFGGQLAAVPDLVAFPDDESTVAAILDWCAGENIAVVPFGGGSSVVGGVTPEVGDSYAASLSLDLRGLDRALDVDVVSQAAHLEAGMLGPQVEDALRPHGLTLRHYPQSHQHSTLGGWLATRSAGHHATLATHLEDRVEALRILTPRGAIETRRLPASGAGPSTERLLLGSEGTLGVITSAWLRVQRPVAVRRSAVVRFASFDAGLDAARTLAQSGLHPAVCRLLDGVEAMLGGAGDGTQALLSLGLESPGPPLDQALRSALEICGDHGGRAEVRDADSVAGDGDAAAAWRSSFLRAPYLRDAMVRLGLACETFETAVTWDRAAALIAAVHDAARRAHASGRMLIATRLTHLYSDGCAPYFTVIADAGHGAQVQRWHQVKAAVSQAVLAAGGTITHHHAVGRDHMRWLAGERRALATEALAAVKRSLDPAWIMNPGVLLPPTASA